MHRGQRGRHGQVVVHRRTERRRQLLRIVLAGARVRGVQAQGAEDFGGAQHEAFDALVGGDRLLQRLLGELQHRPVVRLDQVVAQLGGPDPGQHVGDQQGVAERLAHLLPGQPEQAVVQPVPGEAVTGRLGLRDLVLVVREDQVHPAAVDVERRAQVLGGHGRALQVPAGPPGSPGRLPVRLAGLGRLPQREVARVPLQARVVGVLGRAHLVQPLAGQRPVRGEGVHVEVHVAARRVGVLALDQPAHQHDHLRDVPGGARLDVRRAAAHRVVGPGERPLVALGDDPGRDALAGRGAQDLVLDVGDVAAEGHPVTAGLQPPDHDVEAHGRPQVADVRRRLHRGAAQVHRHLTRRERRELAHRARGGVVKLQGHGVQAKGYRQ